MSLFMSKRERALRGAVLQFARTNMDLGIFQMMSLRYSFGRDETMELLDEVDTMQSAAGRDKLMSLQDFLDWLIENQDEIIKLILTLIELFSGLGSKAAGAVLFAAMLFTPVSSYAQCEGGVCKVQYTPRKVVSSIATAPVRVLQAVVPSQRASTIVFDNAVRSVAVNRSGGVRQRAVASTRVGLFARIQEKKPVRTFLKSKLRR